MILGVNPGDIETWVWSGRSPEEEMVPHSSILAGGIPWPEEPGGLQCMGSHRVIHDWAFEHHHTEDKVGTFFFYGMILYQQRFSLVLLQHLFTEYLLCARPWWCWSCQFRWQVDTEPVSTHGIGITRVGRLDWLGINSVLCKHIRSTGISIYLHLFIHKAFIHSFTQESVRISEKNLV